METAMYTVAWWSDSRVNIWFFSRSCRQCHPDHRNQMVLDDDKAPQSACHTHTPIMTLHKETWKDTVEKGCHSQNLHVGI